MKFLFLCMGNTCRSPMAEGLMKALSSGKLACEAASAGVCAYDGAGANREAILAMKEYGIDISGHRSRRFEKSMADGAVVLCMESSTFALAKHIAPDAEIYEICRYASVPGDIPDPYGLGSAAYRACAEKLAECTESILRMHAEKNEG